MGTWVRLKSSKHIEIHGVTQHKVAGDWVEVGKQTAMRWLADGSAEIPSTRHFGELISPNAGLYVLGSRVLGEQVLGQVGEKVRMEVGVEHAMPWTYTCVWDTAVPLHPELLPAGFGFLKTWQMAVPLWRRDQLACHVGSETDRQRTKDVIRDLRVMMYDTRLMFLKRCEATQDLIVAWREERESEGDWRLAFLRALYRVKPMVLALPSTWLDKTRRPR